MWFCLYRSLFNVWFALAANGRFDQAAVAIMMKNGLAVDPAVNASRDMMGDMRVDGEYTDVQLVTDDGSKIQAHKAILCCQSPYFRAILEWRKDVDELEVSEFDGSIVQMMIDYMYWGSRAIITNPSLPIAQLFQAADFYDFPKLRNFCAEQFKEQLNIANCVFIHDLTRRKHFNIEYTSLEHIRLHLESILLLDLMQEGDKAMSALRRTGCEIYNFMSKLQKAVVAEKSNESKGRKVSTPCPSLLDLHWNHRKLVVELDLSALRRVLQSDKIYVRMEESILVLILWWTIYEEGRIKSVPSLLPFINFSRFNTKDLEMMLPLGESALGSAFSEEVEKIVGVRAQSFSFQMHRPSFQNTRRRILAIGGWSGRTPTDLIEMYNPGCDEWSTVQLPGSVGRRAYHGLTRVGSKVYLVGGFDGGLCHQGSHVLSLNTLHWSFCSTMHLKRCYVSVARLSQQKSIAMGGYREPNQRTATVEIYDPKENQWALAKSMIYVRSDSHAARLNDGVYMVGGFDGNECLNTVEMFDPNNGAWYLTPRMITARSGVGAGAVDGCIYAVGGYNGQQRLKTVERFDPREGKWLAVASMHDCRSNFGIETIDSNLFVAGGYTGTHGTTNKCEKYDPRLNQWMHMKPMSVDKSALFLINVKHWNPYSTQHIES